MPLRPVAEALNCCGLLLALGLSLGLGLAGTAPPAAAVSPLGAAPPLAPVPVQTAPDRQALPDATGTLVALQPYRRIVSASLLADPLLLALAAPDQIAAFSARAGDSRDAYRYSGKPQLGALRRAEDLLTLKPDLVLVSSLGDFAAVQHLRDAGLTVFDLGPMRGVQTFLGNLLAVGCLLGRRDAARELALHFQLRLQAIAAALPPGARRGALYLGVHGGRLYGGTRGSSYYDVLSYAGLDDVAAREFSGWPSYDPEQVLSLDPEIIVTQTGMGALLCRHTELARLRACSARGQVIEIDPRLLNDAGLGMLDASELIHRAAYPGERRP